MRTTLLLTLLITFRSYSQDSTTTAYLEQLRELTNYYDKATNVDRHTEKPKPTRIKESPEKQEPPKDKTEKAPNEAKVENESKPDETHFRELLKVIALLMVVLPPIRFIFRITQNQVK